MFNLEVIFQNSEVKAKIRKCSWENSEVKTVFSEFYKFFTFYFTNSHTFRLLVLRACNGLEPLY